MRFLYALAALLLLEMLIGLLAWTEYGNTLIGLQAVARFSGRLSLLIFSIIFIFSENSSRLKQMLSNRYFLIFAIGHGIHFIELALFVHYSNGSLMSTRALGGALAYLLIFIMPVIESFHKKEKISNRSFRLCKVVYLGYIWLIFALTYLPRVLGQLPHVGGQFIEFVILMVWIVAMLLIKILYRYIPKAR